MPSKKYLKKIHTKIDTIVEGVESEDEKYLIGVHCTHGINRTGYVICSYLAYKMGTKVDIQKIIEVFNNSRSHNIDRQYLIDDLLKKYKKYE